MKILGLHCSFTGTSHDSSVCLIEDGVVTAALEEERFSRVKTSVACPPERALRILIEKNNLKLNEIDVIACDGITFPDMENKLSNWLSYQFGSNSRSGLPIQLYNQSYLHCMGAFLSSGFSESISIDIEGVGDKISTRIYYFDLRNNRLYEKELYKSDADNSLGIFYGIFTQFLGFEILEGEYKVMGMSAYGTPSYDLSSLITVVNGELKGNYKHLLSNHRQTTVKEPFINFSELSKLLKLTPRFPGQQITQDYFNLAASVQKTYEDCLVKLTQYYMRLANTRNVALGGGCALNALANLQLQELVGQLYVMPASSDRGIALGAALTSSAQLSVFATAQPANNSVNTQSYSSPRVNSMFLGHSYSNSEVRQFLSSTGIKFEYIENPYEHAAKDLKHGKVIGWHSGKSEFGPRALGNRSILASPRIQGAKNILNEKIKFREEFRPFAPVILDGSLLGPIPKNVDLSSMTTTIKVSVEDAANFPEAVHQDYTSRVQIVDSGSESSVLKILQEVSKFEHPSLINTSFNLKGEPIVETPADALRTFISSGLDVLYISNFMVKK